MDAHTYVLASSIAVLLAVDQPLPLEASALVMVGLVLKWLLKRDNRSHAMADRRLTSLEQEVEKWQHLKESEQHLKHAYRNEITSMRAALAVMLPLAKTCSCEAMVPLVPILERLSVERSQA